MSEKTIHVSVGTVAWEQVPGFGTTLGVLPGENRDVRLGGRLFHVSRYIYHVDGEKYDAISVSVDDAPIENPYLPPKYHTLIGR